MEKSEKRILDKESVYLQYDKGYNHSWNEWNEYHDWDIKTNYIHKDRLSVLCSDCKKKLCLLQ